MLAVLPNLVSDDGSYAAQLKRALLLYNSVVIPDVERTVRAAKLPLETDIAFLLDHDLVRSADPDAYRKARAARDVVEREKEVSRLDRKPPWLAIVKWEHSAGRDSDEVWAWQSYPESAYERHGPRLERQAEHYVARELASELRRQGDPAISVFDDTKTAPGAAGCTRCVILKVVLENVCFPEPTTSLEDIIAFRENAGNRQSLLGMRRWVRGLAEQRLAESEVREEVEYLLRECERSLSKRKASGYGSTVEAFLLVSTELVEAIMKLKLKKLAEIGLRVFRASDDLLSSETPFRGEELSYLVRMRQSLGAR